mmetsp:Transcript_34630/g.87630  ORF Transcript_34630/g.87630 Transcript_34630/m.87630 type:complete len:239 (-) Transcript_34630:2295-3011(-)
MSMLRACTYCAWENWRLLRLLGPPPRPPYELPPPLPPPCCCSSLLPAACPSVRGSSQRSPCMLYHLRPCTGTGQEPSTGSLPSCSMSMEFWMLVTICEKLWKVRKRVTSGASGMRYTGYHATAYQDAGCRSLMWVSRNSMPVPLRPGWSVDGPAAAVPTVLPASDCLLLPVGVLPRLLAACDAPAGSPSTANAEGALVLPAAVAGAASASPLACTPPAASVGWLCPAASLLLVTAATG